MTKRIARRNGLTIALVLIVIGLLCTAGITRGAASAEDPSKSQPSAS